MLVSTLQALARLKETWTKVEFVFQPHHGSGSSGGSGGKGEVCTVKMEEQDFEALEDNQVLVQVRMNGVGLWAMLILCHFTYSSGGLGTGGMAGTRVDC